MAFINKSTSLKNTETITTNISSDTSYEWEYYYDYIDPVAVDASQLKYNKCKLFTPFIGCNCLPLLDPSLPDSIVIILWVTLAAFLGFLFLTLNLMSLTGKLTKENKVKGHQRASTA
ncbi:melanocortin-2 receptor accessory protein [Nothobranchius furzeri]